MSFNSSGFKPREPTPFQDKSSKRDKSELSFSKSEDKKVSINGSTSILKTIPELTPAVKKTLNEQNFFPDQEHFKGSIEEYGG